MATVLREGELYGRHGTVYNDINTGPVNVRFVFKNVDDPTTPAVSRQYVRRLNKRPSSVVDFRRADDK